MLMAPGGKKIHLQVTAGSAKPEDKMTGSYESLAKLITFTCRMRSSNLGYGVHEDRSVFQGSFCDRLFSIGVDGVDTRRMASVHYPYGGISTE